MDKATFSKSWVRGSCIGRGCYGTVNLAVDKATGAVFAVKSVNVGSGSPSQVEALENEIRILRSLSSPHVVEYLGDDVTWEPPSTAPYRNLHMELSPGGTVADLAKQRGADMDESTVRSFTWCVVSALRYLHARGIVHCDVKAQNVLAGPTPGMAKLADFGSAMEILPRTSSTIPRGSPLWMAPEVIRGEYQGPESDVWSLGCTVIEMITGKPAWEDRGPAETLWRIGCSDELPEFPYELSESGRDFLAKCLQREPGKRWSCDQLLQHPFISSSSSLSSIVHSSPRCVIDWFDSDSEEEENDEDVTAGAKERIKGLACGKRAEWESEGWMAVRSLKNEIETENVSEARKSEHLSLLGVRGESSRVISTNSDYPGCTCNRHRSLLPRGKNDKGNDAVLRRTDQSGCRYDGLGGRSLAAGGHDPRLDTCCKFLLLLIVLLSNLLIGDWCNKNILFHIVYSLISSNWSHLNQNDIFLNLVKLVSFEPK